MIRTQFKAAGERLKCYNAQVVRSNYSDLRNVLDLLGIDSVDGVLMDLGVSSHQLDTPERGFSYHYDAPFGHAYESGWNQRL